jgi:hypothetical protein
VTSQTRLAQTAGFLHHGQSRRRAAAVNMPGSRTRRPGLTAASTGTPSKAEEPRYQPQDQRPVYTDTLTSSGHAELVNYHHVGSTQQDALDIEQVVDGSTHRPGGASDPHSYYVYEKPVLAPAEGVVTFVLDGRPDLPIGEADDHFQAGNQIVMDIGGGHYLAMHHLRQNSLQVRVGDHVTEGQQIALVGNSGNTTEPHIHIHAQTVPDGAGDIRTSDVAETLRSLHTYKLVFRHATQIRGGVESRPSVVDPRRGDIVRPAR